MADHYFSQEPGSISEPARHETDFGGRAYTFYTDSGVFSKGRLDPGSALLIECVPKLRGSVADLGCGWGPIGIILASRNESCAFTLLDINSRAVELCRRNIEENRIENARALQSDGFASLDQNDYFGTVVTNPPIRAGKAAIYSLFEQAHERLLPGGAFYAVIRKQQGAPSAKAFLESLFGNCQAVGRGSGYHVLKCEKK